VIDLNHVRKGSGDALILIHSLGGSIVMWAPVLDRLAEHREVIAVDLPGFGDSPPLQEEIEPSAANLAGAVLDFYESLGIGSDPHVAGISLGGWAAIECARMGRARSATGLCPAGFWRQPLGPRRNHARALARLLSPIVPLLMASGRLRRAALAGQMRHPERVSRAEAVSLIRGYARAGGYPRANELMRGNLVEAIDEIEAPVTLAWAEFDTLVRRTPIRALEGVARQVELPGCGHIPTWDDPELVSRVILEGSGGLSRLGQSTAAAQ
jgi:pimeloyl-ACP methyl ester carboxylesterase